MITKTTTPANTEARRLRKPRAEAESHNQQNLDHTDIWTHAPVARQIHDEAIHTMKITMAEVNAKIRTIACATMRLGEPKQ